jgi:hypothetical protein
MAAMSASEMTRAGASTSVSDTDYEVLTEEGGVERTRPAQARRAVNGSKVDACGKADAPDVDHMGAAFEPVHGIGEGGLERARLLEQPLVAIEIERGIGGGNP